MDSCISQTLGASPAEPGGLPDWARGFLSLPADIEVLRERKRMIDKKIELST